MDSLCGSMPDADAIPRRLEIVWIGIIRARQLDGADPRRAVSGAGAMATVPPPASCRLQARPAMAS
ncbi:hypothetical protein DEM27_17790 [Metarhizobium album]|uniref:Uncharacterized protein n=1 Tax=Metarhizobium album TaxID=2182425 RepID=A0A2U2DNB0_9HYPH|nr:hypothetical protein DEM27_17790 [Rhizobium album]